METDVLEVALNEMKFSANDMLNARLRTLTGWEVRGGGDEEVRVGGNVLITVTTTL